MTIYETSRSFTPWRLLATMIGNRGKKEQNVTELVLYTKQRKTELLSHLMTTEDFNALVAELKERGQLI